MDIIVQKYGGSSISTPEKITKVAQRIRELEASGRAVAVVVSAMGDTTDRLVKMADEIARQPARRELDMLLSTGEQISIALLSMAIQNQGGRAISLTGFQSGIITDSQYSRAKIREVKVERILRLLNERNVVIVAGFQGVSRGVEITTLGRGGSDTTAAALAAALDAECCEIYTDVDGVFTADPNIVPDAVRLNYISYDEMLELAGTGAQVLHPRAIEIAMKFGFPVKVKPAHSSGCGTTVIEGTMLEKVAITGITADKNKAKVAIQQVPDSPGVAAKIFSAISRAGVNIRLIIQGVSDGVSSDISMLVSRDDMNKVVEVLQELCPKVKAKGVVYHDDMAEVSIVGSGIASTPGVTARIFRTLARENINIDLISTSHINVACVVDQEHADRAVEALHRAFKLEKLTRQKI